MARRSATRRITRTDQARKLAVEAARIAETNNSEDIVVLDLRGISPVTDYFVIATGTSNRQMRTVADDIEEYGRSVGQGVWHVAGRDSDDWVLLDFVDVVVHVFSPEKRAFYELERLWGDAPMETVPDDADDARLPLLDTFA